MNVCLSTKISLYNFQGSLTLAPENFRILVGVGTDTPTIKKYLREILNKSNCSAYEIEEIITDQMTMKDKYLSLKRS